jgi:ADP-heptose:LPS heptosyltransferase
MTEVERNAEFMRELGFAGFKADLYPLGLEPEKSDSTRTFLTATRLPARSDSRISDMDPYYVLVPGAGSALRFWPPDRFVLVVDRLYKATGWTGVVCGGPGEWEIGRIIMASANAPLINRIGTTSLNALVEIVAGASLLIGNETGAVHIAASVGTPSVCIAGGGHYGRFVPYPPVINSKRARPRIVTHRMPCFNCDWNCSYRPARGQPAPCVAGVAEEDVWREVERVLQEYVKLDDDNTRHGISPEHENDQDTGVAA